MSERQYRRTTRAIEVIVTPKYLESRSEPALDAHIWSYRIRIENHGEETVRLRSRHWRITDGAGRQQEVVGEGVVGEQPILRPGDWFEYESTSGYLTTPSGGMVGDYTMETPRGESFNVMIPGFLLESPHEAAELRPN
ncbi:MAG: Co2+/Mg2+ efflux protein ApaG [Alphaproteobacteria bacterium]|nr:Co2+/Mg2+ efflux protein ApaG [Alphaproteobacteria bacterium]